MEENNKSIKLIKTGAETFGAAIGGAIGLMGGPVAAIGGSVVGVLISKGISEFSERFLSNREQARVGAAAGLTINGFKENIDSGLTLRKDGFFDYDKMNRSNAEELFEGTLIKCKNEFEEKKIKYISNVFKNVAFDSSVNPENANQILNYVHQLSFRQLLILALVGQNEKNRLNLRKENYEEHKVTAELDFILQDFLKLDQQGLIHSETTILLYSDSITPGLMQLTLVGYEYFRLLELNTISESEFYFLKLLID